MNSLQKKERCLAYEIFYSVFPKERFHLYILSWETNIYYRPFVAIGENSEKKISVTVPNNIHFTPNQFWYYLTHEMAHLLEIPKHRLKTYNLGLPFQKSRSIAAFERELRVVAIQNNLIERFNLKCFSESQILDSVFISEHSLFKGIDAAIDKFNEKGGLYDMDKIGYVNYRHAYYKNKYKNIIL